MRPSFILRAAANNKQGSWYKRIPYEVWPLIAVMAVIPTFAGFRMLSNLLQPDVRLKRQGQPPARLPEPSHGDHGHGDEHDEKH